MNAMPLSSVFAFILIIVLPPIFMARSWQSASATGVAGIGGPGTFDGIVSRVFLPTIWPDLPQRPTTATSRP